MESPQTQLSDSEVIKRVLNGEKELYEQLMRRNNQLLYRVIRSYLSDDNDVQDTMQDTYLLAYEKLQQYRGTASFSTWLVRIGINEALQRIRELKKHKQLHPHTEEEQDRLIGQKSDLMTPEKEAIQYETKLQIEHAIDQLPDKYRSVFMLREVEDLKIDDIASSLAISRLNVRVRTYRAKKILKKQLFDLSHSDTAFEFGNKRCDAMVLRVLRKIC